MKEMEGGQVCSFLSDCYIDVKSERKTQKEKEKIQLWDNNEVDFQNSTKSFEDSVFL